MFILFAGDYKEDYLSDKVGADTILGFFETIEECEKEARSNHYVEIERGRLEYCRYDWAQALDLTTRETIALTI